MFIEIIFIVASGMFIAWLFWHINHAKPFVDPSDKGELTPEQRRGAFNAGTYSRSIDIKNGAEGSVHFPNDPVRAEEWDRIRNKGSNFNWIFIFVFIIGVVLYMVVRCASIGGCK